MRGKWLLLLIVACESPEEKPPVVAVAPMPSVKPLAEVDASTGPRSQAGGNRPILIECTRHAGGAEMHRFSDGGMPLGSCWYNAECKNGDVSVSCKEGDCVCRVESTSGTKFEEKFRLEDPCPGRMSKILTERCMAGMPPVLNPEEPEKD